MTGRRRRAAACLAAGALGSLSATPAVAHPLTGGPATPGQVAVTVAGLVLVVGGGIAAFTATGAEGEAPSGRGRRVIGVPALVVGLVTVFVGPDVVVWFNSRCSARPSSQATLQVESPKEGAVFRNNAVPVQVRVIGGTLAAANSNKLDRGKGHLQISVDRTLVARSSGPVQVLNVGRGSHQILVEYVGGDHLPFCPRVLVRRNVKVAA